MMKEKYSALLEQLPLATPVTGIICLALVAWFTNSVFKWLILRALQKALFATPYGRDKELTKHGVIERLANVMPAIVIMLGVKIIPGLPSVVVTVTENVCGAFMILTVALALSSAMNVVSIIYARREDAQLRPIKGYVQLVKIALTLVTAVLIIATLIDRSPVILLSGLGAIAAVLMLVFQDTLLSLVASIQISSSDMVRVGDWIEMPNLNADGFIIDIALHTVKVQNWDKTITTLPTRKLITDPFKNWRGMQESGGRRIKRALYLDQNKVSFLSDEDKKRLGRFKLLRDYLDQKDKEIEGWNSQLCENSQDSVNMRRITNIGTFRAYVMSYLRSHPGIHQDMMLLVRQLSPTPEGLPIEIYCFTNTITWVNYETIQSDIFDHLLAILPEFGLQVFQNPSGSDMRGFAASIAQISKL